MGKHYDFGKEGEDLAAAFLVQNGYQLRTRNYRYLKSEIDIIAEQDGVLAIVEVKSRKSDYVQGIAEAVNKKKIQQLVKAADHYVSTQNVQLEIRFDIITILKNANSFEIEHIKDAFYHF